LTTQQFNGYNSPCAAEILINCEQCTCEAAEGENAHKNRCLSINQLLDSSVPEVL